jgi:ATP synthase F1 complex assembly factor 2
MVVRARPLDRCADSTAGYAIKLDTRTLRTPGGAPLVFPLQKKALATLVAHEWDSQDKILKPHSLPLVTMQLMSTV